MDCWRSLRNETDTRLEINKEKKFPFDKRSIEIRNKIQEQKKEFIWWIWCKKMKKKERNIDGKIGKKLIEK